jgi:site-specific DNA-cytosine methylase
MNVLSLFDGMSCGQIALNKAGIKYDKYFACEIKEHAIKVTQHNYPGTIQLGDVTKVHYDNGCFQIIGESKINIEIGGGIDLLIGGSPCQDFSRGNATRDGLQGEKSGLFFHYLRLLQEIRKHNPDVKFLLENVIMKDEDYAIISEYMQTEPVRINSSRVSAQLRDRLYWTNIGPEITDLFENRFCAIPQPKDKGINLKDILENGWTDRDKSRALLESDSRPLRTQLKMFHRYYSTGFTTLVFKDESVYNEMVALYEKAMPNKVNQINPSTESNGVQPYMQNRIFADTGKAPCLTQFADRLMVFQEKGNIRYLTQTELERLQTVPEGYTSILKRDDAACLLGDGWTADAVAHIFSFLTP